ncbi:MAG: hypothetical protein IJU13_00025 [Bacteroidales bacterium]|nr:hypothetical protein [Bacteroidales bacterium]
MNNSHQKDNLTLFQPTFGNRPVQYIGRDGIIDRFIEGLKEPIGSQRQRADFRI